MGYTNKTTHYELPQYVATDKPKYLTDFNETMVAIDTQMYTNAQAAATADGKAVAAKDIADGAVASIGTLDVQINGDPQDPSDTGLAGAVSGIDTDLNTVQSLIGSGTPTTSNQTIIGAINSIEASIAPAEDSASLGASYQIGEQFARGGKLYTALTALTAGTAFTSLVLNTDYKESDALVKQLEGGSLVTAENVSYDNTTSGLTADDVQEALDEIVAKEGDLSDLSTTDKTSLVAAINEVAGGGSSLPYDEILSISAGQYTSYGAALAPIETAYDALTNEKKIHSAILVGDYVARVTNTVSKYFCASYGASGNIFGSECFDLVNHNYTKGAIVGTAASTSDSSSDPQTLPMKLVVI